MNYLKDKSVKSTFNFAKSQTAHYSKSFFLSSAMLPKEKRWDTYALYSFCRYADNIVDNPRNRSVIELIDEVDYLAKEIKIAYQRGESEHPILKPFIIVAKKRGIPMQYPLELLEGVKMDLQKNRYETFDELYLFAYRVAGVVGLMMSYILGFSTTDALKEAEKLGIAMQLTNILRDIQEDKNMDRIYLPMDEVQRFNLTEDDFFQEKMSHNMQRFMHFQVKRAHKYYQEAEKGIKHLTPNTQFAIYSASRIYHGILLKIEARNFNPFLGRVFVKQSKKFGILAREILKTRLIRPAMAIFL
ncbi:MAG: phytoene/squalene synthase family protein [Caldithrix sp.]|nr:phytoene/squalene synthase family protein [Caldithrix sp.]